MFTSTIKNEFSDDSHSWRVSCVANGCPLGYRVSSQEQANQRYVCDWHSEAERNKWQYVTEQIKANKWLFDIENLCRVRKEWHLNPFTEAQKLTINTLAEAHGCQYLTIALTDNIRCMDYEQKLRNAMHEIIINGKTPDTLQSYKPVLESNPYMDKDEDFPL